MKAKREDRRRVSPLLVFAAVLLAGVLIAGGALAWYVWGTTAIAIRVAEREATELRAAWAASPPPVAPSEPPAIDPPGLGHAAWVLRIPAIDGEWPVIAGVDGDELARGVGWYPGSALPGQVGNFAVAGHRISHGEPFRRLLELKVGDEVIVETGAATFTYTLVSAPGDLTVQADDSWVLDPVPGHPDEVPTQALLTLTTAEDLVTTPDRAVGFGTLTKTETP
ncbi:MAG: class E sortase [Tessaracoccus sp.]|uniref:sortase n=1 Tax=Tessaracoccus sp. TaxID=1971211 RepID=UPI001ECD14C2|nr:sortase [Tessaracoccus sp.]MBK7820025.1 class E sortase [Tessaracoccus sp.]